MSCCCRRRGKQRNIQPWARSRRLTSLIGNAVDNLVARWGPTHIVQLAGIASPSAARVDPQAAWRVHLHGSLNVANAILTKAPKCKLLHVGTGMIYGESAKLGVPLDEGALLVPADEYAVTKAAADLALGAVVRRGLNCIRLRPFNHTGPGQAEAFMVPAFAMQIARAEAGLAPPSIHVGDLDTERDFLDVRDIAKAYALALQAKNIEPGTILNIASGVAWRTGDILERLLSHSKIAISIVRDPSRIRPSDLSRVIGNAARARQLLGWQPKWAFEDTITAVLNHCRSRVNANIHATSDLR